jgi:hypothetical protein
MASDIVGCFGTLVPEKLLDEVLLNPLDRPPLLRRALRIHRRGRQIAARLRSRRLCEPLGIGVGPNHDLAKVGAVGSNPIARSIESVP